MSITVIAFLILAVAIMICALAMYTIKWRVSWLQRKFRYKKAELDTSLVQIARAQLDRAGLTEVEVVESKISSYYNFRRKKLYLGAGIRRRNSIYSIALMMKLVGQAILFNTDENYRSNSRKASFFSNSSGLIFLVTLILGLIIQLSSDLLGGWLGIIILVIGIVLYTLSTIMTLKKYNTEKQVLELSTKMIANIGIFNEEEINIISKIYKAENSKYIVDTILTVVYIISFIFKVIFEILNHNK